VDKGGLLVSGISGNKREELEQEEKKNEEIKGRKK
jgi:hypothetical protein